MRIALSGRDNLAFNPLGIDLMRCASNSSIDSSAFLAKDSKRSLFFNIIILGGEMDPLEVEDWDYDDFSYEPELDPEDDDIDFDIPEDDEFLDYFDDDL